MNKNSFVIAMQLDNLLTGETKEVKVASLKVLSNHNFIPESVSKIGKNIMKFTAKGKSLEVQV